MGMGCGMSMVKYILFVFNLLCALGGVAILGIGIAYLVRIADESIEKLFEQWNVQVVPIVFIVIGAIIFIVAFFGCCGAIKESHCMTVTYSTFLMIMLLAQIALAIVVFVYVGDLQESVGRFLERVWTDRDTNRPFWDSTQQALQCCGLDNSGQWGGVLPNSCCGQGATQCPANQAFNVGCREAANSFINSSGNIIAAVALGVAGIELIGFIFACCLANNIRNQSRRSPYQ